MNPTVIRSMFEILLEQQRRGGIPKMPYKFGPSLALIDASYCIDATEDIPTGSHISFDHGPIEIPIGTSIWREQP